MIAMSGGLYSRKSHAFMQLLANCQSIRKNCGNIIIMLIYYILQVEQVIQNACKLSATKLQCLYIAIAIYTVKTVMLWWHFQSYIFGKFGPKNKTKCGTTAFTSAAIIILILPVYSYSYIQLAISYYRIFQKCPVSTDWLALCYNYIC